MKNKFGPWPLLALLLLLGGFLLNKFQVADADLKKGFEIEQEAIPQPSGPQTPAVPDSAKKEPPVLELPPEYHGSHSQVDGPEAAPSVAAHDKTLQPVVPYGYTDSQIPVVYAQATVDTVDVGDTGTPPQPQGSSGFLGFLKKYWMVLLPSILGVIEAIVRITPTEKDNSVFNFLKYLLDKIIPNARAGGGAH